MKPLKCQHKGCKKKHKSTTGYCVKHVEEHSRKRTYVPPVDKIGVYVSPPARLVEEIYEE